MDPFGLLCPRTWWEVGREKAKASEKTKMDWLVKEVPLGLHIQNMKWRFPSGKGELQHFPQESMKLSRGIEEDKNPK